MKMTVDELIEMAKATGFNAWAPLKVADLQVRSEVRDMCADNTCGRYEACWSCPPGCGTLEECAARLAEHTVGILVQTIGDIEDSFDVEAMMDIAAEHKENFAAMYAELREKGEKVLALGAGSCSNCRKCTYPDEPCRFPDKMISSMEAYGMVVNAVCTANGLPYNYGPTKMAYTGCFLL